MVPIWSNVHIYGFHDVKLRDALVKIRRGYHTSQFLGDVAQIKDEISTLIAEGKIPEAYTLIDQYPPDIRVAMKPFITHFSGSKTAIGTAKATVELLRTITLGHDAFISGQISVEGEFYGIHSTIGIPFVIGNQGVEEIVEIPLAEEEKELLFQNADNVKQKIDELLHKS
ncbi:hypothetical protein H8D98_00280 [bacterium]|nr:hypothetical protein [bacterium]